MEKEVKKERSRNGYDFTGTDGGHISHKTCQRPAHRMSEVTSDLLEALNRTVRQKKALHLRRHNSQMESKCQFRLCDLMMPNDSVKTDHFLYPTQIQPSTLCWGGGGHSDWSAFICSYKLP